MPIQSNTKKDAICWGKRLVVLCRYKSRFDGVGLVVCVKTCVPQCQSPCLQAQPMRVRVDCLQGKSIRCMTARGTSVRWDRVGSVVEDICPCPRPDNFPGLTMFTWVIDLLLDTHHQPPVFRMPSPCGQPSFVFLLTAVACYTNTVAR